jgi:deoxyribodipyrimidine photo-lyase
MSPTVAAMSAPSVMWFRRDLRVHDNPALLEASLAGAALPLFVVDPRLWRAAGPPRRAWLVRSLRALDESLGGSLVVRHGDPADVVPELVRELSARDVHVAADFGPYGRVRDERVERRLADAGTALVRTGSPYAVAPGRLTTGGGTPFKVFSPFNRAWEAHGWRAPAQTPDGKQWLAGVRSDGIPDEPELADLELPAVGEAAARERWQRFRDGRLPSYAEGRNRPDIAGTSSMSAHLKYGEVHPRTLLADLAALDGEGVEAYRRELCWREFYADVLWHRPESARTELRPEMGRIGYDSGSDAEAHLQAWKEGRTGFPFVDAGLRQLRAEGWMHNRVRMVVASFLVKDLHLDWRLGARHFLHWLRDGDLASNNQGWQWVAGTGTDPAPYFRIFNPVTQGTKFDPTGDYVRRYVPELRGVAGKAAHEPWKLPGGVPAGYPERIVDHAEERQESLRRYEAVKP